MSQPTPNKQRRQNGSEEEFYAGPASLVASLPSPSLTPMYKRQRRNQGSSDEEQVVLDDIIHQDFRTGGPTLCRLPVRIVALREDSLTLTAWNAGLYTTISNILRRLDVQSNTIKVEHRRWRYDRESHPNHTETIMVYSIKSVFDRSWLTACINIRTACLEVALPFLNVEIADPRGLKPQLSHPVLSSDPFAVRWSGIRAQIISLLAPREWLTMSLLRRGKSDDPSRCPLTILITIPEDSAAVWSTARESIVAYLDNTGWQQVAVEIGRGYVWRGVEAGEDTNHDRILLESNRDWKIKAQHGRSIGKSNSEESPGTLGGFVEIRNPKSGLWKKLALTCFHCVQPSGETTPDKNALKVLQMHGIKPQSNPIKMDQPSSGDHQETLRCLNNQVQEIRTVAFEAIDRRLADPDDFVTPVELRVFEQNQRSIHLLEEQIRAGEEFFGNSQEPLGTVFAGSGLRRAANNGHTLDWALIDVRKERMSENILFSFDEVCAMSIMHPDARRQRLYDPEGKKVVGTQSSVWPDSNLFKFGRTSDFTWGRQNGVAECFLIKYRPDTSGVLQGITYEDFQVVGMPVGQNEWFGQGGDSGAFVLDGRGFFVGLFFGGNSNAGTSYYTSAEDLFASIKEVTGANDVRLADLHLNKAGEILVSVK